MLVAHLSSHLPKMNPRSAHSASETMKMITTIIICRNQPPACYERHLMVLGTAVTRSI